MAIVNISEKIGFWQRVIEDLVIGAHVVKIVINRISWYLYGQHVKNTDCSRLRVVDANEIKSDWLVVIRIFEVIAVSSDDGSRGKLRERSKAVRS